MTDEARAGLISGAYQHAAAYRGPVSQRLWHLRKHDLLGAHLAGKRYQRICDAGCGSGVLAKMVRDRCPWAEVHAYDVNQDSIRFARGAYGGQPGLSFEVRDLLQPPPAGDRCFDFIYSIEVIEHFRERDVPRYLATLRAMGSDQARYLITTPDHNSLWPLIEWLLDCLALAPRLAGQQHLSRFTRNSLALLLEQNGFRVLSISRFCGVSPFLAHVSRPLADAVYRLERVLGLGNLLCCEMEKA